MYIAKFLVYFLRALYITINGNLRHILSFECFEGIFKEDFTIFSNHIDSSVNITIFCCLIFKIRFKFWLQPNFVKMIRFRFNRNRKQNFSQNFQRKPKFRLRLILGQIFWLCLLFIRVPIFQAEASTLRAECAN